MGGMGNLQDALNRKLQERNKGANAGNQQQQQQQQQQPSQQPSPSSKLWFHLVVLNSCLICANINNHLNETSRGTELQVVSRVVSFVNFFFCGVLFGLYNN